MVFNAQALGGGWYGNGSEGWLRILEFLPDGKTVKVKTFSPFLLSHPPSGNLPGEQSLPMNFLLN
jgi:hypothetical protein